MTKIIQDTREKLGWDFIFAEDLEIERTGLKCGDYTKELLKDTFRVERKASSGEIYNNLATTKCKERFYRELEKLEMFEHAYIVCEFPESRLSSFPEGSGIPISRQKYIRIKHRYFTRLVMELQDIFNINLVFCNDRNEAELFVYNIAKKLEEDLQLGG
jgi:hypothetical protein